MRRFAYLFIVLSLLLGLAIASAAPQPRAYLPIAAAGAPLQTTPIALVEHDSGIAQIVIMRDTRPGAAPDARRFFVATATRPDYRLRIAEDVDGVLIDVGGAPTVQLADATYPSGPAWSPDGPKQGAVGMAAIDGGLRIVYTSRRVGDPTGPFYLWRVEIPIPGAAPLGP